MLESTGCVDDGIFSSLEGSATSCAGRGGCRAGCSAGDVVREFEELCALGFELPGMRFFLNFLGCFFSLSVVGVLWNRPARFLSFVCIPTSGCFSSASNLSLLVTAVAVGDADAKLDVPTAVGAKTRVEGEALLSAKFGAAGESPLEAAA